MYNDRPEFKMFSNNLAIVKDGVAEIIGRYKLAWYVRIDDDICVFLMNFILNHMNG
jgi:hypothetical protein